MALARVEPPHRVIRDYIAGMTDGFFQRAWSAL
jgi:dGTP triphosphohydrolase